VGIDPGEDLFHGQGRAFPAHGISRRHRKGQARAGGPVGGRRLGPGPRRPRGPGLPPGQKVGPDLFPAEGGDHQQLDQSKSAPGPHERPFPTTGLEMEGAARYSLVNMSTSPTSQGNSAPYLVRRLKRDAPEIAEALGRGSTRRHGRPALLPGSSASRPPTNWRRRWSASSRPRSGYRWCGGWRRRRAKTAPASGGGFVGLGTPPRARARNRACSV
jgi:hypothetical protein